MLRKFALILTLSLPVGFIGCAPADDTAATTTETETEATTEADETSEESTESAEGES